MTAELCEVQGLGWFVEIEILAPDRLPGTVQTARKRLFGCLAELGIGESSIETRYYTDILAEAATGLPPV